MIDSLTGNLWQQNVCTIKDSLYIRQNFGLPTIIADVLASKSLPIEDIEHFLKPSLKNLLPDPYHLLDMKKTIERLINAINNNEQVVIFGDYDVDGATSSSLLKLYFDHIGLQSKIYIPDRITEGYGPNVEAFKKFKNNGASLCITVDCGTVAYEPICAAKACDLDVIVIDHHISMESLPQAFSIINPNRVDQDSECTDLAAVGVSFLMLVALNRRLKNLGYFTAIAEPNLLEYLDLVALGTVCDVVKLVGLNRAFVYQGLKVIAKRRNIGLKALVDVLQIYESISTYHLGFILGPSINAGGRIGNSNLGATLLSTHSETEAYEIANILKDLNETRKQMEQETLDDALKLCKNTSFGSNIVSTSAQNFVMVYKDWHPGLIGIIASRLKDRFNLPSFVISLKDDIGKASARSIEGINIGSIILSAKLEDIILDGGGHSMAGGFSIIKDKIPQLITFFNIKFANINTKKIIRFEAYCTVSGITTDLVESLIFLEPFGAGNKEPLFVIKDLFISDVKIIKNDHLMCRICDKYTKKSIKAMAFRALQTKIGEAILSKKVTMILCKIKKNSFADLTMPEIIIEDVA